MQNIQTDKLKRKRRNYLIAAVTLITINIFLHLLEFIDNGFTIDASHLNPGYFIGNNFFLLFGLLFLRLAHKVKEKIKFQEINKSIGTIGKEE